MEQSKNDEPYTDQVDKMVLNPARYFKTPKDLMRNEQLSVGEKYEILKQWDTDCRLLSVAEDENMQGGERNRVQEVHLAIQELEQANPWLKEQADDTKAPTKAG